MSATAFNCHQNCPVRIQEARGDNKANAHWQKSNVQSNARNNTYFPRLSNAHKTPKPMKTYFYHQVSSKQRPPFQRIRPQLCQPFQPCNNNHRPKHPNFSIDGPAQSNMPECRSPFLRLSCSHRNTAKSSYRAADPNLPFYCPASHVAVVWIFKLRFGMVRWGFKHPHTKRLATTTTNEPQLPPHLG